MRPIRTCQLLIALIIEASISDLQATVPDADSPTSTQLSVSPDPSAPGQNVDLRATVTTFDAGTPTGTVSYSDGDTLVVANVPLLGNVASYFTSSFSAGTHNLSAHYNGDAFYAGSIGVATLTVDDIFTDGFEM